MQDPASTTTLLKCGLTLEILDILLLANSLTLASLTLLHLLQELHAKATEIVFLSAEEILMELVSMELANASLHSLVTELLTTLAAVLAPRLLLMTATVFLTASLLDNACQEDKTFACLSLTITTM